MAHFKFGQPVLKLVMDFKSGCNIDIANEIPIQNILKSVKIRLKSLEI